MSKQENASGAQVPCISLFANIEQPLTSFLARVQKAYLDWQIPFEAVEQVSVAWRAANLALIEIEKAGKLLANDEFRGGCKPSSGTSCSPSGGDA